MFKYAPGMESGLGAALNMMRKHAEPDGDEETREILKNARNCTTSFT